MKSYWTICFFLSVAMILFPLFSVDKATEIISQQFFSERKEETTEESVEASTQTDTVKVMSASSNNITEIGLRDYLIGVIAEEVNPAYHEEAIKAQAVASHTKLEYTKLHKTDSLKDADITDSSASHQGYLTVEEQKEKWGKSYEEYRKKIEKCVDEVLELTVQYNGEPINAAFHAISNGQTENAADVWGGEYPYLLSVQSAGDKLSPAFISQVKLSAEEFKKKLSEKDVKFNENPEKWVEKITNTQTGMVKNITICGKNFKGTEIRSALDLKSSTFNIKYEDGEFVITANGYGHGVGMSQYGADYMARQGFKYDEILKHYYTGVEVK